MCSAMSIPQGRRVTHHVVIRWRPGLPKSATSRGT